MQGKKRQRRMILLSVLALIVIAAAVIVLLLQSGEEEQRQSIVLPSASQEVSASPSAATEDSSDFVEVTRDNVLTILTETLQRPSCYYQTLTVERAYDGGSAMETVSVWRRENVYRITLQAEGQTALHYLTDGETLYLWYDDEQTATQTVLPEGWTVDDLIGIPTYEEISSLDEADLLDASSVELSGFGGEACVYVQYQGSGDDVIEYLWISLDSGMLLQAHTVRDGDLTYRMLQTELQTLSNTDPVLDEQFRLPDGTSPF